MIPKTLVISDLHLTTASDPKKFRFLKKLISSFDRVIINGDLWCVYTDTFDQFINSDWQRLFPLLKSKKQFILTAITMKQDIPTVASTSFVTNSLPNIPSLTHLLLSISNTGPDSPNKNILYPKES